VLAFAADHALARDAVHAPFSDEALMQDLRRHDVHPLRLASRATDRRSYLLRPDLGRRLDDRSLAACRAFSGQYDIALVIGDGLSATATMAQVPTLLDLLIPLLIADGFTLAPIALVAFARVAVADEVGDHLGAKLTIMLLGERPGLGTADSLGAYLTYDPRLGRRDGERNCVSNIRPAGLPLDEAAQTISWLAREALRRRVTGTDLKDERKLIG
jgi:ethanolamine ammonia-lyase small subunit